MSAISGIDMLLNAIKRDDTLAIQNAIDGFQADVNHLEEDGGTSLHYAASLNRSECVKCLIFNKADPNVKDKMGLLPLDHATLVGANNAVEVLKIADIVNARLSKILDTYLSPTVQEKDLIKLIQEYAFYPQEEHELQAEERKNSFCCIS
jgi:ankyrin repeat protein